MPYFAHVSLILAPDRSKLSKRHGATSVGQVGYFECLVILQPGLECLCSFPLSQLYFYMAVQGDGILTSGNGQLPCAVGLG